MLREVFAATLLLLLLAAPVMAAENQGKTIVVGVIGPMTLPEGQAERNAVMLAAEQINEHGGILGHKIKVIVGDTKLNSETAAAEFRRLATVDGAKVIIGGFSSAVMLSMMETMAQTKTIFLADSSSPAISKKVAENYQKYKYWFRVTQNNGTTFAYDLADMIRFLRSKGYDVKRVFIIRDEHVWTDAVMKTLRPLLKKMGVKIVADVAVPRGFTEYDQLIMQAEDKKADLIMPILAIVGTGDILAKAWATLKPNMLLAGHDLAAMDPGFYKKTNGMANYEIFLADGGALATAPPTKMCKEFLEAYKKKYGHYPESHLAYGAYDALFLYKMAVEKAAADGVKDPFNPDVVVKYLEMFNASHPARLTRVIAFTKSHDLMWGNNYVRNWISQWQNGKQVIIYPKNVANGKLMFPPWVTKSRNVTNTTTKPSKGTPGFTALAAVAAIGVALLFRKRR